MADRIIRPTLIRGHRYFQVGDCLFSTFKSACEAAKAAQAHRLDLLDLVGQFRLHVTTGVRS